MRLMPNCALCDLISSSHGKHSRASYETTIDVNSNKRSCIKRFKKSAVHRIDQTLYSEQLGDRQPSKFLRLLQRLPSSRSPNPIFRELFPSFSYHNTYECFPPFTENLDKYATTNGEDTFTQIP
ncbi:hypothetical protein T01_5873 [Trichinella spiralis]|uniref:Uncharacterized protein n=1 Tax=Trichinella spiralis TaxID=6334 RepID=A0A0V1AWG2_TRISP|nr:hypothetical protein T01_5873 [Trichinella spiralis]